MIGLIILIIVGIAGLVAFAYDESNGFTTTNSFINSASSTAIEGMEGLRKLTEQFNEAGDSVAFFAPKSVSQIHPDMDTGYNVDEATGTLYYENGTAVPESSYITGIISDTSFSRTGIKETRETIGENGQMLVQIGNIATIQGQIKILDPKTSEIVEPRFYKYWLIIECNDSTEFCNLSPISKRGTTTSSGTFIEKWTTSFKDSAGLYDVKIMAESETTNELGRKYTVDGLLQIELFK